MCGLLLFCSRKLKVGVHMGEDNIEMVVGEIGCKVEGLTGSGQCPVAGFCECDNETLDFIKVGHL